MHQYLFQLHLPWGGTFRAASYGFMILIGFLLCLWLLQRRGRRMGLDPTALFDSAVAGLFGGIIGARIFYVLDNWSLYAADPIQIIRLDRGGLAFFGGLIGGTLTMLFMRLAEAPAAAGDARRGGHAGAAGARMGPRGLLHERLLLWQDHDLVAGRGVPRRQPGLRRATPHPSRAGHPRTRPARAADGTVRRGLQPGHLRAAELDAAAPPPRRDTAWVYAVLYGSARFTNEFFRIEPRYAALGGLTLWQALCLAVVAFGIAMLVNSLRKPPEPVLTPWVAERDKATARTARP